MTRSPALSAPRHTAARLIGPVRLVAVPALRSTGRVFDARCADEIERLAGELADALERQGREG